MHIVLIFTAVGLFGQENQMDMGMNIGRLTYWSEGSPFTDVMTSASSYITYTVGVSGWDTRVNGSIPKDSAGYPLELPYTVDGNPTGVRFLINNHSQGEYLVSFDGEGEITWNVEHEVRGGKHYITLDGGGGNTWLNISASTLGNHLRNFKMIPVAYEGVNESDIPIFREEFLRGLRPFKTIRFMNWTATNETSQSSWSDRSQTWHYTQARTSNEGDAVVGMAIEYAIALANELQVDAWFCVPHKADADYIRKFAELVKRELDPQLSVYIEYSNEIWNWQFTQAHYVLENAPDAEPEVSSGLRAVGQKYCGSDEGCHPEKDAFMMARVFKIWEDVWVSERSRLITVAAVQGGWIGNTGRILEYLFDDDGVGADAVSPTGYFNFTEEHHNYWNSLDPSEVTAEMIIDVVDSLFESRPGEIIDAHAEYAAQYGIDYIVYEAGQHMQPWMQGEWEYNQAVWDAQIHPKMYDLYMKNLQRHVDAGVKLYTAFSYVGGRESRYGSWGHLESLGQLEQPNLKVIAPKYQALLDSPLLTPGGNGSYQSSSSREVLEVGVSSESIAAVQPQSKKVYYIGHSLMNTTIPPWVQYVSESAGHENEYGYQIVPGAPLKFNWQNDGEQSFQDIGYSEAFGTGTYTDVVMTEALPLINHLTWSDPYGYAAKFDSLAKAGNPDVQTYMFESWHCINSGTSGGCEGDENNEPWKERILSDLANWESIVDSANENSVGKPMVVIPGGQAMAALYDSLAAGVVPLRTTHDEFFADDIHPNGDGWYLITMLYYSVFYHTNPAGLPVTLLNQWGGVDHEIDPALAAKLQEIAWHTACNYAPLNIDCSGTPNQTSSNAAVDSVSGQSSSSQIVEGTSSDAVAPINSSRMSLDNGAYELFYFKQGVSPLLKGYQRNDIELFSITGNKIWAGPADHIPSVQSGVYLTKGLH